MQWFGNCEQPPEGRTWADRIAPPIEHKCRWCDEFFEKHNAGLSVIGVGERIEAYYYHIECYLRWVLGSIGHQQHLCKCFPPVFGRQQLDDPPGFTMRQSALAAWDWFHFKRIRPELRDLALRNIAADINREFGFE